MRCDNKDPPKREPPRLLSKKQIWERVPLSSVTIWKKIKRGEFPKSHRIGGKVFWLESDITAWIEANTNN